jgi:hypothetical protein
VIAYAKEGIGEPISCVLYDYCDFSASCFYDYFCLLIVYFRAMRNNSQEPFPEANTTEWSNQNNVYSVKDGGCVMEKN